MPDHRRTHREYVESKQGDAVRPTPATLTQQLIEENTLEACEKCRVVELLFISRSGSPRRNLDVLTHLQVPKLRRLIIIVVDDGIEALRRLHVWSSGLFMVQVYIIFILYGDNHLVGKILPPQPLRVLSIHHIGRVVKDGV